MLLEDVRTILTESTNVEHDAGRPVLIRPEVLLRELLALDERPWRTWSKGHPITVNRVGRLLGLFGIKSKVVWLADTAVRGYLVGQLEEAIGRYLAPDDPGPTDPAGAPSTSSQDHTSPGYPPPDPLESVRSNDSEDLDSSSNLLGTPLLTDSEPGVSARKDSPLQIITDSEGVSAEKDMSGPGEEVI
jgi:hypothetical protein